MSLHQFDNSIIPVLVGMARVPELSEHHILIRHVVHDLEAGQFERAIQTLDVAYKVFDLPSLLDLKRFIEGQTDSITREISTPAWKTVVTVINGSTRRWHELTYGADLPTLLRRCRSLLPADIDVQLPEQANTFEYPPQRVPVYTPVTTSSTKPMELQSPVQHVQRHIQRRVSTPRRVNLGAALVTFVIALLLAGLFSLASH